jgi:hypothetical protein
MHFSLISNQYQGNIFLVGNGVSLPWFPHTADWSSNLLHSLTVILGIWMRSPGLYAERPSKLIVSGTHLSRHASLRPFKSSHKFFFQVRMSLFLSCLPFRCYHIVVQANLETVFVMHCPSPPTSITTSRLSFMAKFTHATAEHTEMCRRSTAWSTMLSELVQIHQVSDNQGLYLLKTLSCLTLIVNY